MRASDLVLLLSLLDGSESPSLDAIGRRSPLKGMWRLVKFLVFVFLLVWFLFSQNFFTVEVKPVEKARSSAVHKAH